MLSIKIAYIFPYYMCENLLEFVGEQWNTKLASAATNHEYIFIYARNRQMFSILKKTFSFCGETCKRFQSI